MSTTPASTRANSTSRVLAGVLNICAPSVNQVNNHAELFLPHRAIIERFKGHVVRADNELLATFDSVYAALNASIVILRNSKFSLVLQSMQIAVHAGEVCFSGHGCSGAVVEHTIALSRKTRSGELRLSQVASDLLSNRITAVDMALIDNVWLVDWNKSSAKHSQLPILPERDEMALVGRSQDTQRFMNALDATIAGRAQFLSVTGDAGTGKTRLVTEFAQFAQEKNALVLYGAARQDALPPYGSVVQAFEFWSEEAGEHEARLTLLSGDIIRMLPELNEKISDLPAPVNSDAETERRLMFEAVVDALVQMAILRPVVFILDGLHWEGDATFVMLQQILENMAGIPILMVTTQSHDESRAYALFQKAKLQLGAGNVSEIEIGCLSAEDIAELLQESGTKAQQLAKAIHLVTRGLPLEVTALLQHATDHDELNNDLPVNIRDAIHMRLKSLQPEMKKVIEAASVLGENFTALELTQLLNRSDDTYDQLDALDSEGIFSLQSPRTLTYQFAHPMMRDVAISALGGIKLARLHERAGVALEQQGEVSRDLRVFDLARHFTCAAALGHLDRAVTYSRRAAQQAYDQYANEDAARLFQDALDLCADPSAVGMEETERVRCELEIGLGRAKSRLGHPDFRDFLMSSADRAKEIGDGELMSRALLSSYRGTFSRATHVEQALVDKMFDALELLANDATATRVRLMSHLSVELVWAEDRQKAITMSTEAVRLSEELRDNNVLIEVLAHHQWVVFHPLNERVAVSKRLHQLAEQHPDPRLRFEIACHEVFTWTRAGDSFLYIDALQRSNALANEINEPMMHSLMLLRNATDALMRAQFERAQRLITERKLLEQSLATLDGKAAGRVHDFWLGFELRSIQEGEALLALLLENLQYIPRYLSWAPLALYAVELGCVDRARLIVAELSEHDFGKIPVDQTWLSNLCQLAPAVAVIGNDGQRQALLAHLQPHAQSHANTVFMTQGSVARYTGLLQASLDQDTLAKTSLRAAIEANRNLGAPTWQARAELDLIEHLCVRRQHSDETHEQLKIVRQQVMIIGLPCLIHRANGLQRRYWNL